MRYHYLIKLVGNELLDSVEIYESILFFSLFISKQLELSLSYLRAHFLDYLRKSTTIIALRGLNLVLITGVSR
jgi:hypothetical protein